MKRFCLLLIILLNIAMPCYAMVYYAAVDGMDANSGTDPTSPWTLQTAVNVAVAGDEIQLKAGVYQLKNILTISVVGNGQDPITLKPYDENLVTLNAGDSPDSLLAYAVHIKNDSYAEQPWVLRNLKIKGGQAAAIRIDSAHIRLENCEIEQYAGNYIELAKGIIPFVLDKNNNNQFDIVATKTIGNAGSGYSIQADARNTDDSGEPSGESDGGGGCTVSKGQNDIGLLLNLLLLLVLFVMRSLNCSGVTTNQKYN